MFKDLIDKLPGALEGVVRFFGWTEVPTEIGREGRKMIASALLGYAVGLGRRAGFSLDDLTTMLADDWSATEPKRGG